MSKSNATETSLLEYIFTATNPSWHAATDLDIHLHTADPGALVAHLSGTSSLTATPDFTLDADWLLDQFAAALLLDLV